MSRIESGISKPSLEKAMRIQVLTDGEVAAAELRPDLAPLLHDFVSTPARAPAEAAV